MGREGEREGGKHQCVAASHALLTGDLACNPGMCSDWESNWPPFGSQAGTQSTQPHQPRRYNKILFLILLLRGDFGHFPSFAITENAGE